MPEINVDTTASDTLRKSVLLKIIRAVIDEIDDAFSENVAQFMLHLAWHEGARITARQQQPTGPGSSFYQFEAARAKDGLLYAKQKKWLGLLADSSGLTEQQLTTEANALPNGSGPWPSNSLIKNLLRANNRDRFATQLTRIVLRKLPGVIPSGHIGHANYWADHWKIVFDSEDDRYKKIGQFVAHCEQADAIKETAILTVPLEPRWLLPSANPEVM